MLALGELASQTGQLIDACKGVAVFCVNRFTKQRTDLLSKKKQPRSKQLNGPRPNSLQPHNPQPTAHPT